MIFLLQSSAQSYARECVNITKVSVIQALSSEDVIVFLIADEECEAFSKFLDLMNLDWKVVVGIPEVATFNSILVERRSEVLISYNQFVEQTQNNSKELNLEFNNEMSHG